VVGDLADVEAADADSSAAAACPRHGGPGGWSAGGEGWGEEKKKIVGPMFEGGNGGPLGMEGERENLKEYAKWRSV
jgi:hypothetical protein